MPAHRKVKARTTKATRKVSKGAKRTARRASSGKTARRRSVAAAQRVAPAPLEEVIETEEAELLHERDEHPETSPNLSGGDVDADWQRAYSAGEEAVGGSAATPDQDIVDEIGRALGVEQGADAEVRTSRELFEARRRLYWHLERKAEPEE